MTECIFIEELFHNIMRIQMKNAFDKNLCILHSPEYNKVYISVVFPNLLNTSHTKYKFSCGNKSTPGRPQNLVENIFMKYYWTRIPTVLQIIFDNESTIPIVRKLFLRSLPDPCIKYKIRCDRISVFSVLKSLCPAGARLDWAVLQEQERMLITLCVPNAITILRS